MYSFLGQGQEHADHQRFLRLRWASGVSPQHSVFGQEVQGAEKVRASGLLSFDLRHRHQQHEVRHQRHHGYAHQKLSQGLWHLLETIINNIPT